MGKLINQLIVDCIKDLEHDGHFDGGNHFYHNKFLFYPAQLQPSPCIHSPHR